MTLEVAQFWTQAVFHLSSFLYPFLFDSADLYNRWIDDFLQ